MLMVLMVGCVTDVEAAKPRCARPNVMTRLAAENTNKVDILFMIDTSSDNYSEQATLSFALPDFMHQLIGADEVTSPDIHVGFITADLGTGGHVVPTCLEPRFGDDARLRGTTPHPCGAELAPSDVPFLSFREGSTRTAEELAAEAVCLTSGGDGCGIEQPLDALLKALTPASSPFRFAGGTLGHASDANDGFLREDAVLAVVLLANEDDCSIRDSALFDRTSSVYTEPNLSLRCFLYEDALHPLQRYVDGLLAVRPAERLVFAAIAGVPEEIASSGETTPWDALVGEESVRDPRMIVTVDAASGTGRCVACGRAGRGESHAAVRIASVARDLEARGARSTVHSICADTYDPAMAIIADQILGAMSGACVDLTPGDDDEQGALCDVVEVLSEGTCEERHGRVPFGVRDGRPMCKICRGDEEGQVIDDDPACQALGQAGWRAGENSACPSERAHRITFAPLPPISPRLLCPDADTDLDEDRDAELCD